MRHRTPLLSVVLAAAVLAAVPGCAGAPALRGAPPAASSVPATGDFSGQVDVGGGRKLHLSCKGSGSPVVVLESGLHDSSDTWTFTDTRPPVPASPAVFPGVAAFTRVCVYDRPGTVRYTDPPALTTRSTPVDGVRSLTAMADDLDRLLTSAHLPGPYVLAGHSFGGMITRLYAQRHPGKTAGLVFVDAFGTDIRALFGARWAAYRELLDRPGTPFDAQPAFERVDLDGAIDSVTAARPLPAVPMAVLSKTEPFAAPPGTPKDLLDTLERAWPRVQQKLVELGSQTPHFLATGSDHYVQVHDPDLTISAIRLVVGRVRAEP
ncbi:MULTISPECIES: alpha/beta fold hydrolase [Streptomyces]|uniref:Alpha/beta hydrolase n=1 Tax=Streptomyces spororaveus TaxID=284039 RepID=A0ABQ3T541_9ACTN|nr:MULTISPECIES: alpha/beta hydrolase [Streptomyces]MCM9077051.1 alpha/beta hydrolase [Streptomyces spororaveus]MCX5308295.1 alpha/beta hydrolase [Streptomyces sp. NBC_00160]GHI75120.1 alpha/beta hydrolase [Streptomyces spororaveus]